MSRKEVIRVVVSPEEKAKAQQLAKSQGLTLSAYLRRCIVIAQVPHKPKQRAA